MSVSSRVFGRSQLKKLASKSSLALEFDPDRAEVIYGERLRE